MSYDSSDDFYHLTPRGLFEESDEAKFPIDRVETWHRKMRQASGWSKEDVSWNCVWADPAVARSERDELRAKYSLPVRKGLIPSIDGDSVGKPL
jgi:hypothetical protein